MRSPTTGGLRLARPFRLTAGNRYGSREVVVAELDGDLHARPDPDRMVERLRAIDPDLEISLAEVSDASVDGSAPAWVARVAAALQQMLIPAGLRGGIRPGVRAGGVRAIVETIEPRTTAAALSLAARIVSASGAGIETSRAAVASFVVDHRDRVLSANSLAVVRALERRRIAWRWQWDAPAALVIGEGRRRRRIAVTVGEGTSYLAASIAEHKEQCTRLLAHHRMPVPRQRTARTVDAAVAAARDIGWPVVVKPLDRSGGLGVSVNLSTPAEVEAAFERAARELQRVVIESMLEGDDHRLLVIGDRMVAACRRLPAHVVGDGTRTVDQLVAAANDDPRRRGKVALLQPILVDEEALRLLSNQSLARDAVPARDARVWLRSAANRSQGGVTVDVTQRVHPDNAWLAVRAARLIGLDVAGIDLIIPDIARSFLDVGGGICEVNRAPALLTHISAGEGPDVAAALVDHALGDEPMLHVPIVVLVGDASAEMAAATAAAHLQARGHAVGLATAAGLVAAGLPLIDPGPGNPHRVSMLVDDPNVSAIVVAASPAQLSANGLGHARCDLAVAVDGGVVPADSREVLAWLARCGAQTATIEGALDPTALAGRMGELLSALPGT